MSKEGIELLNSIYYRLGDETELSKEESNLLLKFIKTNSKEIERLNNIIKEVKKIIKWSYEEHEFQGAIHSIEELIKRK